MPPGENAMAVPRLADEARLQLIAAHAIAEDLPEPVWDPSSSQIDDGGQQRWRDPHPEHAQQIARWIARWSHNRAENTTDSYAACLRHYFAYCEDAGAEWSDIVGLRDFLYGLAYPRIRYLQKLRRARKPKPLSRGQQPGVGWNTICQYHAAIAKAWATEGIERPSSYTVWREWFDGLHRHLAAPVDQKSGLLLEDLTAALATIDSRGKDLVALRDRAMLLLGWHAALRVSELCALQVEDLHRGPSGWLLHIRHSKTDQFAQGRDKPLWPSEHQALCPIAAWQAWCQASGLGSGPLFRGMTKHGTLRAASLSSDSVRRILGQYVDVRNWGAHSLRIGYVTQARLAGAATEEIMVVTHHRRREMVDHYAQQVDAHRQGPGSLS
ncbi:MAG: hypothetical protein EA402_00570 [Planctomycetota bacterium]|nr:MAG: hypothetical protein EA402_00570 [Planctomycetota bacterium]